ncbi:MAG: response regulator [Alphaproteobacteria bacterium]|nr:response regulator [Alphaproteobacteria bacterium]
MARIIVIEDELELRELLVDELEDAGHHIFEARDGVEGLAIINAEDPDVIISDVGMPNMDGYQLWQRLQNCPRFSNKPFLFLSAFALQQAIDKGIGVGACDYLTKPVDFGVLRSRIDAYTA